jgi:hypothetical protein
MRAAVFRQGRIVVGTIPDPVLAEGQVLARPRLWPLQLGPACGEIPEAVRQNIASLRQSAWHAR